MYVFEYVLLVLDTSINAVFISQSMREDDPPSSRISASECARTWFTQQLPIWLVFSSCSLMSSIKLRLYQTKPLVQVERLLSNLRLAAATIITPLGLFRGVIQFDYTNLLAQSERPI
jgi:hypothetical protein